MTVEKFQSLADVLGVPDPKEPDKLLEASSMPATRKDFCKRILDSPEYRESLRQRIVLGTLPPAIEQLLYYYADGKPKEIFEHTGKDGKPIETISEVRRVIVHASERHVVEDEAERVPKQPSVH